MNVHRGLILAEMGAEAGAPGQYADRRDGTHYGALILGLPAGHAVQVAAGRYTEHAKGEGVTWLDAVLAELCLAFAQDDLARLRDVLVGCGGLVAAWVEAIDRRTVTVEERHPMADAPSGISHATHPPASLAAAVEAALAFHVPATADSRPPFRYCSTCSGHPAWPCPEVQAIRTALDGGSSG